MVMKLSNDIVVKEAHSLGFDLVGFAKAELLIEESNKLKEWLRRGYQSGMKYMERNLEKRKNVGEILPDAKSIISLALNYYTDESFSNDPEKGKISRYAWGKDYHLVIWDKLLVLENALKELDPAFDSISYVDTGPVMDKVWAKRAGLGWIGKHTNLINKELGSWIFLSTIITNYEFNYSNEIEDFCGSCTACIEACPTNAIIEEYVIDSNRCISNLTIENKGEIPSKFKNQFDRWIYGCDICQDVCPWNTKNRQITALHEFRPYKGLTEILLDDVLSMDNTEFKNRFSTSPIKRAKLKGLKRNAGFLKSESF
jgi:epoxyqueuosine reductase